VHKKGALNARHIPKNKRCPDDALDIATCASTVRVVLSEAFMDNVLLAQDNTRFDKWLHGGLLYAMKGYDKI
jgi:hypothetical protein